MRNSIKITAVMLAVSLVFIIIFAIGERPADTDRYGENYSGQLSVSSNSDGQGESRSDEDRQPLWTNAENVAPYAAVKTDSVKSGQEKFAVDGDYNTEWQFEKNEGAWISLDWEESRSVRSLMVTWRYANVDSSKLSIQLKDEDDGWKAVQFTSSRSYLDWDYYIDRYIFKNTLEVKGIRIVCNGTETVNGKEDGALAIVELEVFGDAVYADRKTDFTIENGVLTQYSGTGGKVCIPAGVIGIDDYALDDSASSMAGWITELTVPEGVAYLGRDALSGCDGLSKLSLPASLNQIGLWALPQSNILQEIIVHKDNPYFTTVDGVLFTKDMKILIQYPAGKSDKDYVVPEGVEIIGSYAFSEATYLMNVTLPSTLKALESGAFYGCADLHKISIPANVTLIEGSAFSGCTDLKEAEIKANITAVPEYMFYGCINLRTVTLPSNITEIGTCAFVECMSLESITLPSALKTIEDLAFKETGLEEIVIPNGAETIGASAFYNCRKLLKVELPSTLQSIGSSAFDACIEIETVIYPGGKEKLNGITGEKNSSLIWVYTGFNKSENIALNGTAFADSSREDYDLPEYINDGDASTQWITNSKSFGGDDSWFGIKWDETQTVGTLIVRWGDGRPTEDGFKVQISDDGNNWSDVEFTSNRETETGASMAIDVITFDDTITTENIRIVGFETEDTNELKCNTHVKELEAYSQIADN